jgi:hypothetical protein
VASDEITDLQSAIPVLQDLLKRRAVGLVRDALAEDEDFQSFEDGEPK